MTRKSLHLRSRDRGDFSDTENLGIIKLRGRNYKLPKSGHVLSQLSGSSDNWRGTKFTNTELEVPVQWPGEFCRGTRGWYLEPCQGCHPWS